MAVRKGCLFALIRMRQSETEEWFQRPRKKKANLPKKGNYQTEDGLPDRGMSFMFCDLRMAVVSIWDEYADERAAVFPGGDGKRPADSGKALADIAKRDMRLAVIVP